VWRYTGLVRRLHPSSTSLSSHVPLTTTSAQSNALAQSAMRMQCNSIAIPIPLPRSANMFPRKSPNSSTTLKETRRIHPSPSQPLTSHLCPPPSPSAPQSHPPGATPHLRLPSPLTSCQPHSSVPLALTLRTTSRSSTRAASLPNTLGMPRLGSHERVMGRRRGLERVYRCILRLQPYHQSRPVHTTRRDYYYYRTL
jgi:hypothetical protein